MSVATGPRKRRLLDGLIQKRTSTRRVRLEPTYQSRVEPAATHYKLEEDPRLERLVDLVDRSDLEEVSAQNLEREHLPTAQLIDLRRVPESRAAVRETAVSVWRLGVLAP